jgi:hypothetical protein
MKKQFIQKILAKKMENQVRNNSQAVKNICAGTM